MSNLQSTHLDLVLGNGHAAAEFAVHRLLWVVITLVQVTRQQVQLHHGCRRDAMRKCHNELLEVKAIKK